jgi:hypothetical protein
MASYDISTHVGSPCPAKARQLQSAFELREVFRCLPSRSRLRSGSSASAPSRTPHAPTARTSVPPRRHCENGHTPPATQFRRKSQRVVLLAPGMRLLLESLRVTKQNGNRPDQAGSEQRLATPQLDGSPHVGGVSGQNGDYSTCYQRDCASLECCSVLRMSQRVARGEHWTA